MAKRRFTQTKKSQNLLTLEPRWKTIEKVVALLETALLPSARVEHNMFLPVLGRPDRSPRQCDIVIRFGKPPRETITIIEVQDRNSRPNITMFHGWVKKMREVGAQHLICVSARGFPESIRTDVEFQYGPTVRLMTLGELEKANLPGITMSDVLVLRKPHFLIEAVDTISLESSDSQTGGAGAVFGAHDAIFAIDAGVEKLSILDLVSHVLSQELEPLFRSNGIIEPDDYTLEATLTSENRPIYAFISEVRYHVREMKVRCRVTTETVHIPITFFEYRQEFHEGCLAWIGVARGESDGREIYVNMVFTQDPNGNWRFTAVTPVGIDNLALALFDSEQSWLASLA